MITGSYDLDIVEEAFDVILKIDLSFKKLVNARFGVLSARYIDIMIISVFRRVDMLELCLMMTIRKLLTMSARGGNWVGSGRPDPIIARPI